MDNELVLKKIEQLMELWGYTKYQLAKLSGISQSTLTTIFTKRSTMSIKNLNKICSAFHMSLSDFFKLTEEGAERMDQEEFPVLIWEQLAPRDQKIVLDVMKRFVGMMSNAETFEDDSEDKDEMYKAK
ncbi:MAG: helix-turn-helix domain-containing protein [Brotaphodocola sp.]